MVAWSKDLQCWKSTLTTALRVYSMSMLFVLLLMVYRSEKGRVRREIYIYTYADSEWIIFFWKKIWTASSFGHYECDPSQENFRAGLFLPLLFCAIFFCSDSPKPFQHRPIEVALRNGMLLVHGTDDGHRANGIGPGTYHGERFYSTLSATHPTIIFTK